MGVTQEQLDKWRVCCAAATPGPWRASETSIEGPPGYGHVLTAWWDTRNPMRDRGGLDCEPFDAHFIVMARDALPALLEEVARLRAEVNEADMRQMPEQHATERELREFLVELANHEYGRWTDSMRRRCAELLGGAR